MSEVSEELLLELSPFFRNDGKYILKYISVHDHLVCRFVSSKIQSFNLILLI
jgi:hypothetical protein